MLGEAIRDFSWTVEKARILGIGLALVTVLVLRLRGAEYRDVIGLLEIVLPVVEMAIFGTIVVFCFEGQPAGFNARPLEHVEATVAWFAAFFVIMQVNVSLVRQFIDSYVQFGLSPIW